MIKWIISGAVAAPMSIWFLADCILGGTIPNNAYFLLTIFGAFYAGLFSFLHINENAIKWSKKHKRLSGLVYNLIVILFFIAIVVIVTITV